MTFSRSNKTISALIFLFTFSLIPTLFAENASRKALSRAYQESLSEQRSGADIDVKDISDQIPLAKQKNPINDSLIENGSFSQNAPTFDTLTNDGVTLGKDHEAAAQEKFSGSQY